MALVPFRSNVAARQEYDPFRSFRDEFDRLFDDFLPTLSQSGLNAQSLMNFSVDISESDAEIQVKAELPGVAEKDIDVQLNRDILTIRGEKQMEKEEKERNYHLRESHYGSFTRSVRLPFEPQGDKISAVCRNGVLKINIPKPEKAAAPHTRIEVKSA